MSIYGCETSPVNESELATLRSSIADLLTFSTTRRSVDLTYAMASYGKDVDPDVEIASRRAMTFRRMMHKQNDTSRKMKKVIAMYLEEGGSRHF